MAPLAEQLRRAILAAGVAIDDVAIGDAATKPTWRVRPATLQPAAQATIDAFDPTAQAVIDADVAAQAALTAQQKDLIATIGLIVSRTDANWGTYTVPQKVAATQAAVTAWKTLRAFVEKNL